MGDSEGRISHDLKALARKIADTTSNKMSYFDLQFWETDNGVYRLLRVRKFRPFVAGGQFWRRLFLKTHRSRWNRGNYSRYVAISIIIEIAHTCSALILTCFGFFLALKGAVLSATGITLLNLGLNIYPILVTRYNRARILRRSGKRVREFLFSK